jgi:hypothetical protein
MSTKNAETRVAIIGLGKIGEVMARNLVNGGHSVILASRDLEKAKSLASQLGSLATAKETTAAIKEADVIIPTVSFNSLKDFVQTYAVALEGKVIVDVSNPIAPDGIGGFKKIVEEHESAGQILSRVIPKGARLIKAFGTLGAGSLAEAAFSRPDKKVLFYASDSMNSNRQIEELISSSGFEPFHMGGIDQSIRIEVFGELHEFGRLGKTVTLQEVKTMLSNA